MTIGQIERAVAGRTSAVVAVIRAMPNTPALVGEGRRRSAVERARPMRTSTGPSGSSAGWAWSCVDEGPRRRHRAQWSGPAYVFLVAEALIDAAVAAGLAPDLASTLTSQLLVGSAKLLAERGDPAALRAMVTSPGGTTAAALQVLDAQGVRAAFGEAVQAATRRSRELSPDR